jgi:hypothetical protein
MIDAAKQIYTSRIIKAGALLADTKALLTKWDEASSVVENLARFRQENLFGKNSRSRVEDILTIFRQRYLTDISITQSLITLAKGHLPAESFDRILYFFAAQADRLLHDTVTEFLWEIHSQGRSDVHVDSVQTTIARWVSEGKATKLWNSKTTLRAAQELMATLRDFNILQGKVKKHLAPVYLPIDAFAFIAFYLKQHMPAQKLLNDPEWRLYFLTTQSVEHYFLEAHQYRLLEYNAAGSAVRITFPTNTIEEYAHVIVQRATGTA